MRQGEIACLAVAPSIVAAGLILLSVGGVISLALALVLLGVAVLLTLLIDRRLTAQGITPSGWMALRVPLSLGLGSLSIIIGALCGYWRPERYPLRRTLGHPSEGWDLCVIETVRSR